MGACASGRHGSYRATTSAIQATSTRPRTCPSGCAGPELGAGGAELCQLLHQPRRHPLDSGRLHVAPQRHLEPVAPAAVLAAVEVGLGERDLVVRQLTVEVALEELL